MELKEKLTRFRRDRELSQTELAQSLGVTRQAVSGWERGASTPSAEKLIALSRLYGVPLDELVNGAVPPGEEPETEAGEELGTETREEPGTEAGEEPEPAPPEVKESPRRMALPWRAVAAALAGCILFTGLTLGMVLGFALSKEPETPKIIRMEDMNVEDIDLDRVIFDPDAMEIIVP